MDTAVLKEVTGVILMKNVYHFLILFANNPILMKSVNYVLILLQIKFPIYLYLTYESNSLESDTISAQEYNRSIRTSVVYLISILVLQHLLVMIKFTYKWLTVQFMILIIKNVLRAYQINIWQMKKKEFVVHQVKDSLETGVLGTIISLIYSIV